MRTSNLGSQFSTADILIWLSAILEDETRSDVNWHRVAALSLALKQNIDRSNFSHLPFFVSRFIEDWPIRRADPVYGRAQRNKIKTWLNERRPKTLENIDENRNAGP